ncbi:hypothetical protein [Streptomyces sp. NPDC001286]
MVAQIAPETADARPYPRASTSFPPTGDLGEIRRMLADPYTGITALQQVRESRHSKVLEHVTYSTTGVREENRALRRRQERMLSDLGQVRTAVDDLRREIAQAWACPTSTGSAAWRADQGPTASSTPSSSACTGDPAGDLGPSHSSALSFGTGLVPPGSSSAEVTPASV